LADVPVHHALAHALAVAETRRTLRLRIGGSIGALTGLNIAHIRTTRGFVLSRTLDAGAGLFVTEVVPVGATLTRRVIFASAALVVRTAHRRVGRTIAVLDALHTFVVRQLIRLSADLAVVRARVPLVVVRIIVRPRTV
jgi:hypothetical protein